MLLHRASVSFFSLSRSPPPSPPLARPPSLPLSHPPLHSELKPAGTAPPPTATADVALAPGSAGAAAPHPKAADTAAPPHPPTSPPRGADGGAAAPTGNNYARPGGQNVGNFLTDRPSSRVLAPPGGGSQITFG
jgi:protein SPIRAL1 and related proteins